MADFLLSLLNLIKDIILPENYLFNYHLNIVRINSSFIILFPITKNSIINLNESYYFIIEKSAVKTGLKILSLES
jgi:hypothetical protein